MIKHSLKENLVYVSIDKIDFSFRVPLKKIGNTTNWKIGGKGTEGIVMNNVSIWTLQLFTKKTTDEKYVLQFKEIVQEHSPNNSINWDETLLAVKIQNEYNWLIATNAPSREKMTEEEILSSVEAKYKID